MVRQINFGGYQGDNSVHTCGTPQLAVAVALLSDGGIVVNFRQNTVEDRHKAANLLSITEEGALDGCYFSSSYLTGRVPELALLDQHFMVPDVVKTGQVKAQENPLSDIYNFVLHKPHRVITLTGHLLGVAFVFFNAKAVADWPPDVRNCILAAIGEAMQAQRQFAKQDDTICMDAMIADATRKHSPYCLAPAKN